MHRPQFTPQKHYYFYVSGTHTKRKKPPWPDLGLATGHPEVWKVDWPFSSNYMKHYKSIHHQTNPNALRNADIITAHMAGTTTFGSWAAHGPTNFSDATWNANWMN
jgi:hypothetical protein